MTVPVPPILSQNGTADHLMRKHKVFHCLKIGKLNIFTRPMQYHINLFLNHRSTSQLSTFQCPVKSRDSVVATTSYP